MKYEIIKNGQDDYTLKYKDKEIKFHSSVEIVSRLQEVNEIAKQQMVLELTKAGLTPNDLVKKKIIDGKTYYDNSAKEEYLSACVNKTSVRLLDEASKKMLGMTINELVNDIGNMSTEETNELTRKIGEIAIGRFQDKGHQVKQ